MHICRRKASGRGPPSQGALPAAAGAEGARALHGAGSVQG